MNKMLAGNHRVSLIRQQDQNKDRTITGSYFNCYFQCDEVEAYRAKQLRIIIMKLLQDERRWSVSFF
jgi:hypothetical protein